MAAAVTGKLVSTLTVLWASAVLSVPLLRKKGAALECLYDWLPVSAHCH